MKPGRRPRLRVAVGHRHHARFLQGEHVVDLRGAQQGVDQGQLGGAGIAEDILDALAFEQFEQQLGATTRREVGGAPDTAGPGAEGGWVGHRCALRLQVAMMPA